MTMPNERAKAMLWARSLMKELAQCESAPEQLRKDARHILRHYPLATQVRQMALAAPDFFEVDMSDPIMVRAMDDAGNSDIY